MSLKSKTKLLTQKLVGIGNISDTELMELVSTGNRGAFEMMYNTYKKPLYNFLLNLVRGDEKVAEDLLQDTFLKAYHKAGQFKEGGKLTSWLWAIAKNNAYDSFKKKDALNFTVSLENDEGEQMNTEELVVEMTDAEQLMVKKLERDQVKHCIDKLKDSQKEVVLMQMFSELSYDEISETLQTTVSSVKSMLNRARKSLFSCLKKLQELEGGQYE